MQELKGRNYQEAEAGENKWYQLTEKLILRSFGSESMNYQNIRRARSAGEYRIRLYGEPVPHSENQRNFETRLQAYDVAVESCISELETDLPDTGPKGVYQPGEQYEFYRDVTACLRLAHKEIFVIDPYLDAEIFGVYAQAIQRSVHFRLLMLLPWLLSFSRLWCP